jgi:protein SCO1/2
MFSMKVFNPLGAVAALCTVACAAHGQLNSNGSNPMIDKNVWIEQRLGAQAPLDAQFCDEQNNVVKFGDYFGKRPAILVMPFYKCAGACTLELDGLATVLNKVRFTAGKEFDVIVVSIDPRETFTLAQAKKRDYMELYNRPEASNGWHFLTGPKESIQALTSAIGYRYTQDPRTGQIAHPVGLIYITPQGKVSHYLFGVDYSPRDMNLALVDASSNRIGSLSEYAALLCSHSDLNGKYTVAVSRVLKIAAGGTILTLALFIGALFRMERKRVAPAKVALNGTKAGAA